MCLIKMSAENTAALVSGAYVQMAVILAALGVYGSRERNDLEAAFKFVFTYLFSSTIYTPAVNAFNAPIAETDASLIFSFHRALAASL